MRPRIINKAVFCAAALCCAFAFAGAVKKTPFGVPANGWTVEKQAHHALNRVAFGPSPADLQEVKRVGVARWISAQLEPETVPDTGVSAKLEEYSTLKMTIGELYDRYPPLTERAKQLGIDMKEPGAKEELREMTSKDDLPRVVTLELLNARMVRAVESRRQLNEVLADFWFNHFNVSADKGLVRWMVTSYERDALRPHLFGKFRDLLGAVAKAPAMLFYLDNWRSTREGVTFGELQAEENGGFFKRRKNKKKAGQVLGLNENYARELLELHTLGVNGGYTQNDVREVARAFTGWSLDRPLRGGAFVFRSAAHDEGEKFILGKTFKAGLGQDDGELVLDLLAKHPATAKHIATKLCRKFVSDTPPPKLVEHVAKVFLKSDGDLRATYEAIFASREFWSDEAYLSKTKTPFELAVSSVRALGGTVEDGVALAKAVDRMGEKLYRSQPPTGYAETAETWVNAGALVNRINFGLALANGRIKGAKVTLPEPAKTPEATVDVVAHTLLGAPLQTESRRVVLAALSPSEEMKIEGEAHSPDTRRVAGLLLGSPEFQKQ